MEVSNIWKKEEQWEDKMLNRVEEKFGRECVIYHGDWSRKEQMKGCGSISRGRDEKVEVICGQNTAHNKLPASLRTPLKPPVSAGGGTSSNPDCQAAHD